MQTNYKQKVKDFFRKEGFYVVLFLCVCLVATGAAISYKQSKNNSTGRDTTIEDNNKNDEVSSNINENNKASGMQNAEIAKDNSNSTDKDNKDNNESKTTSAQVQLQFENPVDGKLIRGYTYPKPVMMDETNQRTIRGVDIEAKIGTNIKAAEDGIIEKIENTGVEDGMTIVIAHANGIKTKYTNLNENVNVKASETVKKGTVIGTVGDTAKLYSKEKFGEHLNLQVLDANNEQVDPSSYFNFK
ncbi:peptidoglycan DD-metalloendopeptidase family protein [Clostridium sp. HCP1S3_B4]|uniref:peptidoglycan DD-metalloendopeptidase family protein n=1 Tax=unclassified Clostridium TaxID=2614128 RepID=UPI0016B13926|nr:M23 family metallopeptidase [Clostridium sp.]NLK23829.1 M23 family metallopeptidase [Clostridiales bacterium]